MKDSQLKGWEGDSGEFINQQFIAGKWQTGSGSQRTISSPSSGAKLAIVPDASADDLNVAVAGALEAQPAWYALGPVGRANALKKASQRLR